MRNSAGHFWGKCSISSRIMVINGGWRSWRLGGFSIKHTLLVSYRLRSMPILGKGISFDPIFFLWSGRKWCSSLSIASSAFHLSNEIAFNSWQRKWEQDTTGHYTRQFIPKVGTKLFFSENRNTGISYCRLLLNDTMLKDDSYRTGTSESPLGLCDCGLEREAAEHYCFRTTSSCTYMWDDCLTRKDDKLIKDALYQFLTDANRKL